jgi:glycerate-2-kinase
VSGAAPPPELPHAELLDWFRAGLDAVSPARALTRALEGDGHALRICGERIPAGARLVAIAIGKAACAMARELETRAGERIRCGIAITKAGHALALERFRVLEAGHPVPDARSAAAAREALALAGEAGPADWLVVLLSGGASALTALPAPGLDAEALARTGSWLLACGADIEEANCVRKHIGRFGGGRLALAAAGAGRVELLAISDVPGDRLDVIGSGPCSADPSSFGDALAVAARRGGLDALPSEVISLLRRGAAGELPETPGEGHPGLAHVRQHVVARNADARAAACSAARAAGWRALDAGEVLRGEARDVGSRLVAEARRALGREAAAAARGVWIAGGETTVTLRGSGLGGRNQECALAAALAGSGIPGWALLAAGSDGGDGPTDAAGARADGGTAERGRRAGCAPRAALDDNDSYTFFAREGGLVRTGPTHTNVMDLALVALTGDGAR